MTDTGAYDPTRNGFLADGGEMGALIRAFDWASTSMGPQAAWPQPLKTMVRLLLSSGHPMFIWWGPELIQFYNDAYGRSIGPERHPSALGQRGRECWAEIWPIIGPQIDQVMSGEGATWHENQLVPITRNGSREDVYWTYSYSPIDDPGAANGVGGVLVVCAETTETVLAEQAGAAEKRRLELMFRQAPSFMALLRGRDHIFEFVNDAYNHLMGGRSLIGLPVRQAAPDVEGQGFFELLDRVYETGEAFTARRSPMLLANPGGKGTSLRFVDFVYQPVTGDDGKIVGIFVEGSDVTDYVDTQERLVFSEESLRLATDAADVGTWDLDVTTDALTWSDRTKAMFGISPGVPCSMDDFYAGLHPEDRSATSEAFASALDPARRVTYDVEYRTIGKEDGVVRWVAAKGRGLFDDEGRCTRALGTAIDVTARKAAEQRLLKSEADLRDLNATLAARVEEQSRERERIWRNSRDLLVVVGADGVFRAVSPAWKAILGYAPEEVAGRSFLDFVWPDDADLTQQGLDTAASAQDLTNFENRYRHRDGTPRWISWKTSAENGLVYAYGRDITAEKAQAAALEEAAERLRQAQKMEALGQLTGGVAHDFNNLLTPIIGSLDMLQRKRDLDERTQRLVDGGLQSAEKAKTLVQRLLAFARRQPLQPTPVDVTALVTNMADLVASTTGPQIKVSVTASPQLPAAHADPNQLEMAILNLAVNARDAMPDGGTLRIAAQEERIGAGHASKLAPGRYVRVSVADTGVGMDEATLARAVEPFFSTKGVGKGTGLGLSMVHGLTSQLGGAMTVSSRPGLGTNIDLWLPLSSAPAQASDLARTSPTLPYSKGRVLLIDDEDLVRDSTTGMLEDLGYEVVGLATAEEALKAIAAGLAFDLMMTDHLMPGMSGVDLARAVQAQRPDTPILIVSGYAEAEGVAADLPRLTKPFRQADLAESLASITEAPA